MMNHQFIRKEIEPGQFYVIESCLCGAKRRRTKGGTILWEQNNGTFSRHKTPCFGSYSTKPVVKETDLEAFTSQEEKHQPPLIEALAIIRLLMEDRPKGERCAKNFLMSYPL